MNIGVVSTWFERGAAYVSKSFVDNLLETNYQVFIFARGGEQFAIDDKKWNSYKVTWGDRCAYGQINWKKFLAWILDNNIGLIIFNEQVDWEVIVNCRKLNILIVSYIDYYKQDTVELFNLYDAVICNTRRHFEVFSGHNNCIFIQWGTNVDLFRPAHKKHDMLTLFHSAGMGGINMRKGTDIVVTSFARLKKTARLIIHSQVSIEHFGDLSQIIENHPRIEFIHKTVTAPGLYHMGDVYIYPTKLEGIGLTIAEALSCGLPVITTDCAPMNEFVVDGYNGKLIAVNRYISRSDGYYWPECECSESALLEIMSNLSDEFEKNNLDKMKNNARKSALDEFNWKKNASNFSCLIENIAADKSKKYNYLKLRDKALNLTYAMRCAKQTKFKYYLRKLYRKLYMLDM